MGHSMNVGRSFRPLPRQGVESTNSVRACILLWRRDSLLELFSFLLFCSFAGLSPCFTGGWGAVEAAPVRDHGQAAQSGHKVCQTPHLWTRQDMFDGGTIGATRKLYNRLIARLCYPWGLLKDSFLAQPNPRQAEIVQSSARSPLLRRLSAMAVLAELECARCAHHYATR